MTALATLSVWGYIFAFGMIALGLIFAGIALLAWCAWQIERDDQD
jgi:hypothetical protein